MYIGLINTINFNEEFRKASNYNYRLLSIHLGNWEKSTFDLLRVYKEFREPEKALYAFHPWIEGAKDRFFKFKKYIPNLLDLDYSNYGKILGGTYDVVILDLMDDFRPNYISALVDLVRGGGLIIMYSDDLQRNKLYKNSIQRNGIVDNYFEERFLRMAKSYPGVFLFVNDNLESFNTFKTEQLSIINSKLNPRKSIINSKLYSLCLTDDQAKVLDESLFILEDGRRVLTITAPRGRGKSSSIGLFLSHLSTLNISLDIIITSPSYYSSIEIISFLIKGLDQLGKRYSITRSRDGKVMGIMSGALRVKWLAPDVAKDYQGDIIVVDEAASIGTETLDYIVRSWEKVILVTTIHGYEGTGKAFLKYLNGLREDKSIKFKHVTLEKPIRYAKGDPIERFIYDVMLLDAEPKKENENLEFTEIDRKELFEKDHLLRQVYGILVSAHYRNSPDDLMILGDHHFQRIFSLGKIAVAQVIEEGALEKGEIDRILNGSGLEGHLIPYKLTLYERLQEFGKYKGWRIMRIAVQPDVQNKGFGSKLLRSVVERGKREGIDWIGASFVADYRVVNFWLNNGFTPVHLSNRKNEGLNGYSIVVLKALNEAIEPIINRLSVLLRFKILHTAHQLYFNVNPLLLSKILRGTNIDSKSSNYPVSFPKEYCYKIESYLKGILEYNSVADGIHAVTQYYFLYPDHFLEEREEAVLIARTLQGKSWHHISLSTGIDRRVVEEYMRSSIDKIYMKYCDRVL
ncbi:tRNA(Met) cytidine acetyltransferase [Sulfolobus acidocaldarius]|uniref:tRNA(Met) cytidine acetyltransferase TmcA n=3 Tax=Sulfolobus acidocaldarius TaxID=2285 RepID=A0A0U2Y9H3_9CREN|nr:hypothetical protein SacN8_00600 [Sulfolobus acidocaldarius N8]AGE72376.1 hypothetical protein SacRon12I_00600 [Sulfolobus acidocaldarius Ron12/I]ALU29481.1 tRNA(Met) cytidine acetyltransferase [Sulfolobus acidocaldarius]ALU32209.1 tRNA(Met) cytidine acetyltransferase [Sulfolobus acidocaldarius]WCM34127.1 GNAT family N-acetyltransferase [Sulfolobus acidocaldarius DSM 639]